MNKIILSYHVYLIDHCVEMISDQIKSVIHSGLLDACDLFYIGVVHPGTEKSIQYLDWLTKLCHSVEKKKGTHKIKITIHAGNKEETDTLKFVRDYSASNPGDYVGYFHTKGITQYSPPTESWRRYMQYFTINQWRHSLALLREGYDCTGVMWNKDTPLGDWPHFSGNFWWAKTDYINTLDHSYLDHPWRYMREFWIGSNPNVKVFEHHNSGLNSTENLISQRGHYSVVYPEYKYRKNERNATRHMHRLR